VIAPRGRRKSFISPKMREEGFEPSRLAAQEPKSQVSRPDVASR
jgi:hypothetical protein